jgi:hypothetical protein
MWSDVNRYGIMIKILLLYIISSFLYIVTT